MKIIEGDGFDIYVYADDHPPPHCHVRFADGREFSVDIPLIMPRYGAQLPSKVRKTLKRNLNKLCLEWEKLNTKKRKK